MNKKTSKLKRFFLVLCLVIMFIFLSLSLAIFLLFNKYQLNVNELTSLNNGIKVSSSVNKNSLYNTNRSIIQIEELPEYVLNAFVDTEDKRFYEHNGYDLKRIIKAGLINLTTKSKSQGASTISQQLIKNALLSNEKTYSRKLQEIILAIKMEKKFEKDEILEMYLNTIYFGSNAYGIENASSYYFNKSAKDLTLNEACVLAGLIKSPSYYSPKTNYQNSIIRRNLVAKTMLDCKDITENEYNQVVNSEIKLASNSNYDFSYEEEAIYEACQLLNITERELINREYEIVTFKDEKLQQTVVNANKSVLTHSEDLTSSNLDSLSIVSNLDGHVLAYHSNSNYSLHNLKRQPASTLKPLAVYLPCLAHNILSPASQILDEEINYNGFKPNNADKTFHGYVTMRESIANSYNIPAVKALESVGLKKSREMLTNLGINLSKNDLNLSLALGAVNNGVKVTDIFSAYLTLANLGQSKQLTFINKILDKDGNLVYSHDNFTINIVDPESCFLLTDMLKDTAKTGTAKRLNSLNIPIASKTGTAGNGTANTDLYNISYTTEHVMMTWIANIKNNALPSSLHSSTHPTQIVKEICSHLYSKHKPDDFKKPENVKYLPYDLIEFEENHRLVSPSSAQSDRYIAYDYFKKDLIPLPAIEDSLTQLNAVLDKSGVKLDFEAKKDKIYKLFKLQNNEKVLLKEIRNISETINFHDYNVFNSNEIIYFLENNNGTIISEELKVRPKDYLINQLNNEILTNRKKWYV